MLGDQQASTPRGHHGTSGRASIPFSFDLAQDLAVEDGAERHTSLAANEQRYASGGLFVQCVGASDLVAKELGADPGHGCSKTLDCAAGDIDTAVDGVFVDVAQNVRSLHRSAERGHLCLAFWSRRPKDACEHDPHRAARLLTVDFEIVFGVDNLARDVVSHTPAEVEDRMPWQLVTL